MAINTYRALLDMLVSGPRVQSMIVLSLTFVFVPSHWSVVPYFKKSLKTNSSWKHSLIFQEFKSKLLRSWSACSLANKVICQDSPIFSFPLLCLKSIQLKRVTIFYFFFFLSAGLGCFGLVLFFLCLVSGNEFNYQLVKENFFFWWGLGWTILKSKRNF